MSSKHKLKEDIALIENLVQDQLTLIESSVREMEQLDTSGETLRKAIAALTELHDSCTLIKALLGQVKDNNNGQSVKAGAG
jgi:hypothetical protein